MTRVSVSRIVQQLLILGNFDLAFSIVQDFSLRSTSIYSNAARFLVQKRQLVRLTDLMKDVRMVVGDDHYDAISVDVIQYVALAAPA